MGTVIHSAQRSNEDRHQRWDRLEHAEVWEQYRALQAQGVSQRQGATVLEVPRTTLHAWRAYQERLDACPAVVTFFQSVPGLAFLHRLVLAIHLGCVAVGACGMRLGCVLVQRTGLKRFVGAAYGTQQQVNHRVEDASVASRREKSMRLSQERAPQDSPMTQAETFTGGLCLVGSEPVSNYLVLEQVASARAQDTWHARMEQALAGLNGQIMQATSAAAPGLLA